MRTLVGLLVAMSAVALIVIWMPGRDSERQLAVVTEIAPKGIARVKSPYDTASRREADPSARKPRTFSPDAALTSPGRTDADRPPFARDASPPPAPAPEPRATASTGELRVSSGVKPPAPVPAWRTTTTLPTDETSRYELIRNLQRELRRVGCYRGEIDGSWGSGSKRAMTEFTERVNAMLPVDQPDYILLSLVQGHQGLACGRGCPTGQTMAGDGRCVPNVVLSKRGGQREPAVAGRTGADTGWSEATRVVPATPDYRPSAPSAPLPGRMAIGGPGSTGPIATDPSGLGSTSRDGVPAQAVAGDDTRSQYGAADGHGDPNARSVIIYRPTRSASSYRPRTTSRRLTFNDVFR